MLRTSRWFYVQEPIWPEENERGSWFKKRALYSEIISIVKENPGISTGEIARKLGRPYSHVAPLCYHLRRFQSLRYEAAHVERTSGLAEFAELPSVKRMLSKLSSEKTKGPWTRRLYNYQLWLRQKGHFDNVEELLEDYRKARTEPKRYQHIDLIQEYINGWKGSVEYKNSIVTIIRGFYRKNRAELPREKITFNRDMILLTPGSSEQYVKPAEIWRIINDGHIRIREKAIISTVLCMGLDESTFARQFNFYAYPQIVEQLGRDHNSWDLSRAPVQINLVRLKTQTKFYNFLPRKALVLMRDWLNARRDITGKEPEIRDENGVRVSEPLFITTQRTAIDEDFVACAIRESSFRSGVQQRKSGVKRYRIHGHEFRDTFRTTCKIAGVDSAVAEFFIGHSIDKLGYDKSPWVYPEHFRKQYQLVEPYLCGEEQWIQIQAEKKSELEARIQSLEAALTRLVAEKGQQVLAQDQSHRSDT